MLNASYEAHMGNDLTAVNAARVSFGKRSDWATNPDGTYAGPTNHLKPADKSLIQFLARGCTSDDWDAAVRFLYREASLQEADELLKWAKNMPTHWTPFSHAQITMVEKVPIFIARQRFKHTIGFTYNEVSRRYVDDTPEFYIPDEWRSRPTGSVKQGSGDTHPFSDNVRDNYEVLMGELTEHYEALIRNGIAPEQARMILPQSMLTEYWVTGSLYAWANAYIQRSDSHAQIEIQQLAKQWDEIIAPLFPVSWAALTRGDY